MTADAASLRLAALVESSDDAITSEDLSGIIETWNPAAERLFGYTAAEIIGQPARMVVPHDRQDEDAWVVARVHDGEAITHFETTRLTKSGATVDVSMTVSPLRNASGDVVAVSRIVSDISARRQLERAAFRLAAIVDSSEDAIISKALDGTLLTWNAAAERMFGYTAEEAIGRSIMMIIPPERRAEEEEVLRRVRTGVGVNHLETVRRRKDGSLLDISLTVSPVRNRAGQIIGASKIVRDISEQKRLTRELEEASRAKDEFLATLSHELRTPLNAIMGYARMLAANAVPSQRHSDVVQIIERNAHSLARLVSDVLDLSSIVGGKSRLHQRPSDLAAVALAAVEVVRPAAEAKGLTLVLHHLDSPVLLVADPDRLQQVFWNLLSNAVKFTPNGGRIEMTVTQRSGEVEVTISDTGIGIQPELMPHLFQRFRQGDSKPTREYGGLGLGLALVRHYVELHGGTVTVASGGAGQGSTFRVTLPSSRAVVARTAEARQTPA
jgi:two-component system sensor histidine kinase VicK